MKRAVLFEFYAVLYNEYFCTCTTVQVLVLRISCLRVQAKAGVLSENEEAFLQFVRLERFFVELSARLQPAIDAAQAVPRLESLVVLEAAHMLHTRPADSEFEGRLVSSVLVSMELSVSTCFR